MFRAMGCGPCSAAVKVQRPQILSVVSKDLYVLRRAAEVYQAGPGTLCPFTPSIEWMTWRSSPYMELMTWRTPPSDVALIPSDCVTERLWQSALVVSGSAILTGIVLGFNEKCPYRLG